MKMKLLLVVCLLAATAAPAEDLSGTWASQWSGSGEISIHLNLQPTMSFGFSEPLSALKGLTAATLDSASPATAAFTLEREPGTLRMEGTFRKRRGSGVFDFTPNHGFGKTLAALGIQAQPSDLDDKSLLLLTTTGISTARIRELRGMGLQIRTMEDVEAIAIHGITPDFVREMRSVGLTDLSLEDALALRIHGASAAYVREMTALGFGSPDKEKVVEWRIHGVTPKFVAELRELGYRDLSADQLVAMRIHGVTPKYIRDLRAAGFENIPAEKLVDMRIHGIKPEKLGKRKER